MSPYLEVGTGLLPDTVAFYVKGNQDVAKELKLVANCYGDQESIETEQYFYDAAMNLLERSITNYIACRNKCIELLGSENGSLELGSKRVRVKQNGWIGNNKKGYTKELVIQHVG